MLTFKQIKNLFSDFCQEWQYYIDKYDEKLSVLYLKHFKYCEFKDSYIYVDFVNRIIKAYYILENDTYNLYCDVLGFDELKDLSLILNSVFYD